MIARIRPLLPEWPLVVTTQRRARKERQEAFWNGVSAAQACGGLDARVIGYEPGQRRAS